MLESRRMASSRTVAASVLGTLFALCGAAAATLSTGRELADPPAPRVPPPPLETLVPKEAEVAFSASADWRKLLLRAPGAQLAADPTLWRRLHFDDWDTPPERWREAGLRALVARYAALVHGGPARWERLRPADWDRVPQPVRARIYLLMARHWCAHYAVGEGFGLAPGEAAATVGALVMVESWFEHRAVNVGRDNVDLGLAQASTFARGVLRRLERAGRLDFAPADDAAYFDPWQATRVATLWFALMLGEAEGDVDLAVGAYHAGIGAARRGEARDYLDNVRRKRRRYVQGFGAPPAWRRLAMLVERPWDAPPPAVALERVPLALPPAARPEAPWLARRPAPPVPAPAPIPEPAPRARGLRAVLDDARRHLAQLARAPRSLEAHEALLRGHALWAAGEDREALVAYEQAVRAEPRLEQATLLLRAHAHDRLRRAAVHGSLAARLHLDWAVAAYEEAARTAADPRQRLSALGWLALACGPGGRDDRPCLEGALERLRALAPRRVAVHLALAELRERGGQIAAAEEALLRARRACPSSAAVWRELTEFYARRDRVAEALSVLRERVRRWPDEAGAQVEWARLCWDVLKPGPGLHVPRGTEENGEATSAAPPPPVTPLAARCERDGPRAARAALALRPDDADAQSWRGLYLLRRAARESDDDERRAALERRAGALHARVASELARLFAGR